MTARPPFGDLRVLDLCGGICGGYATKLLADAGADVIKVEPTEGDPLRRWSPSDGSPPGRLFAYLHAGKRSVRADLLTPAGRASVIALAAEADIAIVGPAPVEAPLGIRGGAAAAQFVAGIAADLRRAGDRLSVVTVTPHGLSGPWRDRPATEFTLQASTGSTAYRGYPDRPPVSTGGFLGEWVTGSYVAVAALTSSLRRAETGVGEDVDVAAFETMLISFLSFQTIYAEFQPGILLPRSIEVPSIEPTRDGWVGLCTITAQQWMDLCTLIGRPDLADDPGLRAAYQRSARMTEILAAIHAWSTRHTVDEVLELGAALRIPMTPVGTGSAVLEFDHLVERGVWATNPHGFVQPRVPYSIDNDARSPVRAAPGQKPSSETWRAREAPSSRPGSVAGLRVVDFTAFWAGPTVTTHLAVLGADVIKIESVRRPDGMRMAGGIRPPDGRFWEWSPVFHGANPGKRGITLDLDTAEGLEVAVRLVATADIVIENSSPRVMDHFGLDFDRIHALNPKALVVRMPAFGLTGPWRDRTGFAMTIEQATGLAWLTGYPDRSPLVPRGVCDPVAGMHAVVAILAALGVRERTGRGALVEVPLVEVGLNIAAEQVIEWSGSGVLLQRDGNRSPAAAPQGVYECRDPDTWIAVCVAGDDDWVALQDALGRPAWMLEEGLVTRQGRAQAADRLDAALAAWACRLSAPDAAEALLSAGVPAAEVVNARVVGQNPQLVARGYLQTLEHPVTGAVGYPSFPARFGGSYLPYPSPPPTLGQHNDEVLQEVGLSPEEIGVLRSKDIVGEWPPWASEP